MTEIVQYGRDISTVNGNGLTVDGMLFQKGGIGSTRANLAFATTASSATPIVLNELSAQFQHLTGSSAQTLVLPDVSTLAEGLTFHVLNKSTGVATVFASTPTASVTTAGTFPVGTIDVDSTAGWAASGTLYVSADDGSAQQVSYSGTTATSFIGCLGGAGSFSIGTLVAQTLVEQIVPSTQADITCVDTAGIDGAGGWTPFVLPVPIFDDLNSIPFPTSQSQGVWYGSNTATNNVESKALGTGAQAGTGTAIGRLATATTGSTRHIAIGFGSTASGGAFNNQFAVVLIGRSTSGSSSEGGTIAFSVGRSASGSSCGSFANGDMCIGCRANGNGATGAGETIVGATAFMENDQGDGDIACIGYGARGRGFGNIGNSGQTAIGYASNAGGLRSTVVGYSGSSATFYDGRENPQGHGWDVTANWRNCALGYQATANPAFGTIGVINLGYAAVSMPANGLSLSFNPASVTPGFYGLTLNGEARQIQSYNNYYGASTTSGTTINYTTTTNRDRYFSGSSNQLVTLPAVASLSNGHHYRFINGSTGTVTVQSSVPSIVVALPPGARIDVICIDTTGAAGVDGWYAEEALLTSVPTSIPSLVTPTNFYAALKGVPVGGLYQSAVNSATTPTTTFAITASFLATGTTLDVTAAGGVIVPGMFLSGGGVVPGTQILSGPGGVGSYVVDTVNTVGTAPTDILFSNAAPDELYVRSA